MFLKCWTNRYKSQFQKRINPIHNLTTLPIRKPHTCIIKVASNWKINQVRKSNSNIWPQVNKNKPSDETETNQPFKSTKREIISKIGDLERITHLQGQTNMTNTQRILDSKCSLDLSQISEIPGMIGLDSNKKVICPQFHLFFYYYWKISFCLSSLFFRSEVIAPHHRQYSDGIHFNLAICTITSQQRCLPKLFYFHNSLLVPYFSSFSMLVILPWVLQ